MECKFLVYPYHKVRKGAFELSNAPFLLSKTKTYVAPKLLPHFIKGSLLVCTGFYPLT